jgi:hypothetical protein
MPSPRVMSASFYWEPVSDNPIFFIQLLPKKKKRERLDEEKLILRVQNLIKLIDFLEEVYPFVHVSLVYVSSYCN